jgi:hypothetical protein
MWVAAAGYMQGRFHGSGVLAQASWGHAHHHSTTRSWCAVSNAPGMTAGLAPLPRGMRLRLARLHAAVRHRRLDIALAAGADPWSDAALFARAARLGSWPARRSVAAGLVQLVALATYRWPASSFRNVRHRAVLDQRESLLALADRLDQPAPMEIAVVARLALLVSDRRSPVYVGGIDSVSLAEVTAGCARSLRKRAG